MNCCSSIIFPYVDTFIQLNNIISIDQDCCVSFSYSPS
jgi:hypothetical protein